MLDAVVSLGIRVVMWGMRGPVRRTSALRVWGTELANFVTWQRESNPNAGNEQDRSKDRHGQTGPNSPT
eukprot:4294508-Amphidinium_carterae.1